MNRPLHQLSAGYTAEPEVSVQEHVRLIGAFICLLLLFHHHPRSIVRISDFNPSSAYLGNLRLLVIISWFKNQPYDVFCAPRTHL